MKNACLINSVTIIGFVGADPEQRQARNNNGSKFTALQYSISPRNYWARCHCGDKGIVGLNQLLGIDALSCAHARARGFFCLSPESLYCQNCGEHWRFFFNGDGMRTWRCGNCEQADIRAYLRREYDERSSIQFLGERREAKVDVGAMNWTAFAVLVAMRT